MVLTRQGSRKRPCADFSDGNKLSTTKQQKILPTKKSKSMNGEEAKTEERVKKHKKNSGVRKQDDPGEAPIVSTGPDGRVRCFWASNEKRMAYHDGVFGRAERDPKVLFEFLSLCCFQCGLSWSIVYNKRAAFREAFENWNVQKISKYTENDVERIACHPGVIGNRSKIRAVIHNAKLYLEIKSFSDFVWGFEDKGREAPQARSDIPVTTPHADDLAREMKSRGFKFFGPTTAYAFMQTVGICNDHYKGCYLSKEPARKP